MNENACESLGKIERAIVFFTPFRKPIIIDEDLLSLIWGLSNLLNSSHALISFL